MSSRRWPKASSLAGGTFSRQSSICARGDLLEQAPRAARASGFSPAAVILSKKQRGRPRGAASPPSSASSQRVVSRSSSFGGSTRSTCLQKVLERALREGLEARGGLRLAGRARIELGRSRRGPSPSQIVKSSDSRASSARASVLEMGIDLAGPRGAAAPAAPAVRPPRGARATTPCRRAPRRIPGHEARGLGKGGEQRASSRRPGGRKPRGAGRGRTARGTARSAARGCAGSSSSSSRSEPPASRADAVLERAAPFPGAARDTSGSASGARSALMLPPLRRRGGPGPRGPRPDAARRRDPSRKVCGRPENPPAR